MEKVIDKKTPTNYQLEFSTKDNRSFKFYVYNDESQKLFLRLISYLNPKDLFLYYKFAYRYREYHPANVDGWTIYKPKNEYKRQGIVFDSVNSF